MMQKQGDLTALPGVWNTLSAGFELATRYLWLILIPALLDLFLWIGPRLSFRPLIDQLIAQVPVEAMLVDPRPILEEIAPRLNQFTYLSVSALGVPALMGGLTPERTPIEPLVIEANGWGAWVGSLALLTVIGLLLSALFFSLIVYALERSSGTQPAERRSTSLGRVMWHIGRTWGRLLALTALFLALIVVIVMPISLLAGFLALISQALATFTLLAALVLLVSAGIYLSLTPQGMALHPGGVFRAIRDSVRLFQINLPTALGLLLVVFVANRLLSALLLAADSGTWVTAVNILFHAYITTALTAALFVFYRDRYAAFEKSKLAPAQTE